MEFGIIVYEDVEFEVYEKTDDDPWAMICKHCNESLFEGAGQGEQIVRDLKIRSPCYVNGCANTAEMFITLVGSKPK